MTTPERAQSPGVQGTLWQAFEVSLSRNAEATALIFERVRISYSGLRNATIALAARLVDSGVRQGSRVVIYSANRPEFVVVDLALMRLGAVKVPLSSMAGPSEAIDIAARVAATIVVTDRPADIATRDSDLCSILDIAAIELSGPTPDPAGLPAYTTTPDDPAVVYFTGGTTGEPKGIVHSQRGVLTNLISHLLEADINRDDHLLITTPLVHAAGLFTLAALLRGACVSIEGGFDANQVLDRVHAGNITWTFTVPTMINRMVDAAHERGWSGSALRTIQYGAAPISPDLLRRALDVFGPVFQQLYAQTECPDFATALSKTDHQRALENPRLLTSAGRAVLMCEVSVHAEDGAEMKPDEIGEICLRSPYVMSDYWKDPAGFADRFHGSWLRTGDIGYLDNNGYLYIVDRRNDMIVTGGLNVYSGEVEKILLQHPDIEDAVVFGVPDADWGEAVSAHIVTTPNANQGATASAIALCREHLAQYKIPKSITVVDQFPLTRYGKVDKRAVRAPYWQNTTRAVN